MDKRLWAGLAMALAGCAHGGPGPGDAISHYVRSNSDGSMAEHVVHFFPGEREVAVYKWMEKCETAAYVTATMGGAPLEPERLVAGKVAEDGTQAAFGELTLDRAARSLNIEVTLGGETMTEATDAGPAPWMLYDYDLADLHAMLRAKPEGGNFAVSMRMIWPEEPPFFRSLGEVRFADQGVEDGVRRYEASGGVRGTLLADAATGQLLHARFDAPNHPGYADYALSLERTETGGQAAWDALMRAHYADCPAR